MISKGDLVIWDPSFCDESAESTRGDPVGLVIAVWSSNTPLDLRSDPLDRATVLWNRRGRLDMGTEQQATTYLLVIKPDV